MTYFLKKKKWMAWVVLLTFLFTSFMPTNLLAGNSVASAEETTQEYTPEQQTQYDKQIEKTINKGGVSYYKEGKEGKNEKLSDVEISKLITLTGTENEFDIELKVITKENVKVLETLQKEAAVVLVMDTSKSMQWDASGGGYCVKCEKYVKNADDGTHNHKNDNLGGNGDCVYARGAVSPNNTAYEDEPMRITTAVNAATSFVTSFKNSFSDKAMFSLVTFNEKANAVALDSNKYWVNLNENNYLETANAAINNLAMYSSNEEYHKRTSKLASGTNIAGGLQVAVNLLKELPADAPKNRYVILLTDGDPNRGIRGSEDGYTVSGIKDGVDWKKSANTAAEKVKKKATIYTVGFSKDVSDANFMKGLATSPDKYSYAATSDKLDAEFKKITTSITLLANAWQVLDPMGDNIQFLGFYDTNGTLQPSLSNGKETYCKIEKKNEVDTIDWDLKKTGAAHKDGGYEYTLKYKVRLDTTDTDFKSGEFQDTNGKTTLEYIVKKQNATGNDADSYEGPYTVDFKIPKVKGYLAGTEKTGIQFLKTAEDGTKKLPGAAFTLQLSDNNLKHDHDSSCPYVNRKEATYTNNSQATDESGTFSFKDIPSGHTYILTENKPPTGYKKGGPWTVAVNYGEVTVTNQDEKKTSVETNSEDQFIITNSKPHGNIAFTKVSDEKNSDDKYIPLAGAEFGVYGDENCKNPVKIDNGDYVVKSDQEGVVSFTSLEVDPTSEKKVYYIKEVDTDNDGFVTIGENTYKVDDKVYKVTVEKDKTAEKLEPVDESSQEVTQIINHEYITISGEKNWNAGSSSSHPSVTVQVYADEKETKYFKELKNSDWSFEFTAPKYDENGKEITYTVKEMSNNSPITDGKVIEIDNEKYKVTYGKNDNTITNTLLTTVSGTKIWNHNGDENYWPKGATVTVGLYTRVDGEDTPVMNGETAKTATVNAKDKGYSFSDLPKYDIAGKKITYVAKEQSVKIGDETYDVENGKIKIENDTYLVSDGVEANGAYNITNTLTGEGSLTVTKVWADTNNQDGKRPAYITFNLYQISTAEGSTASEVGTYIISKVDNSVTIQKKGDDTTDTVIVNENSDDDTTWSYTFKNLAKCDANGYLYDYYVEENAVTNYITTYPITGNAENKIAINAKVAVGDGAVLQIKNTHTPETATLKVAKTWVDDVNLTNLRGDELTFTISAEVENKIVTSLEKSVTLKKDENWAAKTIDLPKYYQGQEITYLISEEAIPDGYEVSYKLNGSSTNTHTVIWIPAKGQSIIGVVLSWLTGNEKTDNVDCTVIATNTLVTRDFKMTKEYSGTVPADDKKAKFTLTAESLANTGIEDSENIAVGNDGKYTFFALKYGVTYKVEETTVPTGYEKAADFYLKVVKENNSYVVKAYSDSGCKNAITSNTKNWKVENGVYTLTNVVKTADFSFEKKFDSVTPKSMPTFTVRDQNNNIVIVTSDDGTKKELKNVVPTTGNKYEFNNLECGTYTVEENTVSGYKVVSFKIKVTDPGVGQDAVASVEANSGSILPVADANGDYTLTNVAKTTSLTLLKTYNGITPEQGATFTIKEGGSVTQNGDKYTFADLQYGKTYTVVETAPTGYVGVQFTIDVTTTDNNGDPIAKINDKVDGLTDGSQSAGYGYALVNKVKTTGFSFNKVFEENRNTTTPSFVAYKKTKDGQGVSQFEFAYQNNDDNSYQYSIADGLEYGRTYVVMEKNTPAGYETATPFEITIDLDENGNAVAKVTKFGEDFVNGVLTNYLKAAEYEIHYHYQQLEETAQADYLGKYAYKEEGTVKTVPAKVGDQINFNNLTDDDKDSSKHVTTSSVYVFNAEKTETDNQNKIVVDNVDGAKTILNVYFDLRFAVQYHWKGADKKIHDDNTINEPKYDLTLNDVVNLSDNKAPNTDATPDNPWYLFNGQWYATTQQAFDWNFDNAQQWLLEEDKVDKENILTYVKNNVLHLYAAWNAKPAAAGNINVSKTVKVVNEKEGNTDRDKLFDFALDLYVTTGSGLTFEQAKANTTSPSAIDFKVTITDKDGKTLERAATLKDDGNGHYQYLFQLKDGENASFDLKAVASTGSALIWFQLDETSAGEDVGFTTELTGEESTVSGLSGIGCVDENGVYTFGYVNTFTYEADRPTDPEDPTDPERPRDPSDPREPDVDIEDPDVPLAEPDEPPIEIEDPDVPLTDVPGEPIEIDEPEVPLGDAPKTGDSSNAIPFVILMMVGITGLAITRRKFN